MNALFRLRQDMYITSIVPFKHILYLALLSNVVPYQDDEDDTRYGVYGGEQSDLYDQFSDWTNADDSKDEVLQSLNSLSDDGLIFFDDDDRIFLGEYRGKRFFTFEVKSSMCDEAVSFLKEAIKRYGSSKSAKDKSRSKFIRERVEEFLDKGIDSMTPNDFTDLHGYVYEIYTGGEIYVVRNKVEYFQTNNMLKAYDRNTVFSIIVEGTLNFGKYRKKGSPTLTTVACMKDDVFNALVKSGSKEYMRETAHSMDSEF